MARENYLTLLIFSICLSIPTYLSAQRPITEAEHLVDHKPLMNNTWETFDLLLYKVTTKDGKKLYTPYFPPKLAAMDGQLVKIQGYIVPLKAGLKHNRFLLSVLPIHQCMFCGQNGIPAMVEITLADGHKTRLLEKPVTVEGKTILNRKDPKRVEIWIDQATIPKD